MNDTVALIHHHLCPSEIHPGGQIIPINVASDGLSCTLNTRYEDMSATDILTLAHFPKTVVLIEHFL